MAPGAPEVDSPRDVSIVVPEIRRGRVVVRRRRARGHKHNDGTWATRGSRRKVVHAIIVCVAVFLLMGVGLYFGICWAESKPGESARHSRMIVAPSHRA